MQPTKAVFPSRADLVELRIACKRGLKPEFLNPDILTKEERFRWHAYDYGFRTVMGFHGPSPIDSDRQWHDTNLLAEAVEWWKEQIGTR